MKKTIYLFLCLIFAGITNAMADTYRFTATSVSAGVLGHMDFDSSVFDGTARNFIDNNSMLSIDFTNPPNAFRITTIGPSGFGTYFDSRGSLPTVIAGNGPQGGTELRDQVTIVVGSGGFGDPSGLILGNGSGNDFFNDVSWSASVVGAEPEPEPITIDIKPGSDPNSINLCSNGKVPVAILGSATFDVTTVNTESLRFAGAAVNKVGGKNAKTQCSVKDINGDTFVDLVCKFKTTDFVEIVDGTLTGELLDGTLIAGQDTVNFVPASCSSPFGS